MNLTARMPRPQTQWVVPPDVRPDDVLRLHAELNLHPVICQLLVQRGFTDVDLVKAFLRPQLAQLSPPGDLLGMHAAVDRLVRAIGAGETIIVHGDYDVDGMCSTALLTRVLRRLGGRVEPFIPHRVTDGYDLSDAGVRFALGHRAGVVLTADCGTSATTAIAELCDAGVDVIVSDHHLPGGPVPSCVAVLNPKQPGCPSSDKDHAAVGIAFKLALAVTEAMGGDVGFVYTLLDLVALATVADLAPLRGENRVLVHFGLKVMARQLNPGIRALVRSSRLEGKPLTAGRIGYTLAPRLNAAGRLGNAMRGLDLLLTDDPGEANEIARDLEELNEQRQAVGATMYDDAMRRFDALDDELRFGVVLWNEGWHPGVIGVVASRVVEEVCRPAIIVAVHDDVGKGSGRSISSFDLHAGIAACKSHLTRFGGHRAAAGLTIDARALQHFQQDFNATAMRQLQESPPVREQRIDLEVITADLTKELLKTLQYFEPHGLGNPTPVLALRAAIVDTPPRKLGSTTGVRTGFRTPSGPIPAIGWRLDDAARALLKPEGPVDVAFRLEHDDYNGADRLQLNLLDVKG